MTRTLQWDRLINANALAEALDSMSIESLLAGAAVFVVLGQLNLAEQLGHAALDRLEQLQRDLAATS